MKESMILGLVTILTSLAWMSNPASEAGEKKEEKIITTQSGLKYVEVKVGTGATAKAGDTVQVHYTGTFKDGKKFDSSVDRGTPLTFPLGEGKVIMGWDMGIPGMKEGGKRKLIIPSGLAYGAKGFGKVIPPDTDLYFDVELVKVK